MVKGYAVAGYYDLMLSFSKCSAWPSSFGTLKRISVLALDLLNQNQHLNKTLCDSCMFKKLCLMERALI